MIYILVILSILVFLLGAIVFGLNIFTNYKKEKLLALAFGCAFVYTAFLFSIQVNGLMSCISKGSIDQCVHYRQINEIPIIQIGFKRTPDQELHTQVINPFCITCFYLAIKLFLFLR